MEEGVQEIKIGKRAYFTGKWNFFNTVTSCVSVRKLKKKRSLRILLELKQLNRSLLFDRHLESVQPTITPGTVTKFCNKGEFMSAITVLHGTIKTYIISISKY